MGGSFGEVSAIALLLGAAFLFYKKILTWHIPVSFVLSAFLFAWILNMVDLARIKRCNGIICGHIHHPENTYYEEIHYLNSGDWVETLSALVEDEKGNWSVRYYEGALIQDNLNDITEEIYIAS
jgi:hypothetical protein